RRRVLDGAGTQEVALKQELEFLRSYLDVEQVRFRDRLKAVVDAEPDTLDARVPYLILQPLVENAIRHGIAPRATTGRLLISARRIAGSLHLTVRDDGSGLVSGGMSGDSRGARRDAAPARRGSRDRDRGRVRGRPHGRGGDPRRRARPRVPGRADARTGRVRGAARGGSGAGPRARVRDRL